VVALDAFYQTAAQICFTLLGLWWLVLQTKYAEWIGNRARRRMATNISLSFLLPGAMSLMALASHARILWATAFVVASLFGGVETAATMLPPPIGAPTKRRPPWYAYPLRIASLVLYLLIILVALLPGIPQHLGAAPLTVAAVLLTLIVVLGAAAAWLYFAEYHTGPA
jgi:hypothetical protein